MIFDIICPFCDEEFEVAPWDSGECPKCAEPYYWDEVCTEDFSDCSPCIFWEKWDVHN